MTIIFMPFRSFNVIQRGAKPLFYKIKMANLSWNLKKNLFTSFWNQQKGKVLASI